MLSQSWQKFFDQAARPPSQTEIDQYSRTKRQIQQVLADDSHFQNYEYEVYIKGSYSARTNVRRESDIDIAVELLGVATAKTCFVTQKTGAAVGLSNAQLGIRSAPPAYSGARQTFKNHCCQALSDRFGSHRVTKHNKHITIAENTVTIPADIVPCVTQRRYTAIGNHKAGIRLTGDDGKTVINWPRQDYRNGVRKNDQTHKRYKPVVRGLKALNYHMSEKHARPKTPSWLIECLVHNVPNRMFASTSTSLNVAAVLQWLQNDLANNYGVQARYEINGIRELFSSEQNWSHQDATLFVADAKAVISI